MDIFFEIAIMTNMLTQDAMRTWISDKLAEKGHGARSRLAAHLGHTRPDAITRMLNQKPGKESRVIRAEEWERIKEFFGEDPDGAPDVQDLLDAYHKLDPSVRPIAIQQIRALIPVKS